MTERMSAAQFKAEKLAETKPAKYRNKKVQIGGLRFDSKREAARYQVLKAREAAGEISHLELQPVFRLKIEGRPVLIRSKGFPNGRQAKYTADFAYWCPSRNARVVEDVKSSATRTEAYCLRKALVEAMFPAVKIEEV